MIEKKGDKRSNTWDRWFEWIIIAFSRLDFFLEVIREDFYKFIMLLFVTLGFSLSLSLSLSK